MRISDPAARPPLAKRLRPGHWAGLDYLAGAVLALLVFVVLWHSLIQPPGFPYGPVRDHAGGFGRPLGVLLVAVTGFAVALRRRRPVLMLALLLAGTVAATALTGGRDGGQADALTYFLPVAYVLYLVAATYRTRRDAVRVLAAVAAAVAADAVLLELNGNGALVRPVLIPAVLCVIVAWACGYIVRQRRRYAVRLQDEAASKAVAEERLRIARELHDVVAHSMSVIAVQAGYGQYVIDAQPGDARRALGAIQTTSREALEEMRRMLGALRQADESPGTPPALFPAPGLADLDRLVSRTACAGVDVDVTRHGQPKDLPASVDMSAYRLVQEALTNVVKHAHTDNCQVLIGYGGDELTVEVTDNGAGVPALAMAGAGDRGGTAAEVRHGHGLTGMRERVTLLGGQFSAGPLPGYGFRVSARIPLPPGT
ncbi:MAG: sensor histidine kinase [Streptosporangiaceae bacterium]|nr:sensor histidine kinase [Streptosporangiaceae bacterium]